MTSIRSIYLWLLLPFGMTAQAEELTSERLQFFENKIRPVLSENCYECHSENAKKLKGGLLLDSKEGWMHGGDSGQVIVPGDAGESLLLHMISHDPRYKSMPPKSKLKPSEIKDIERWINDGAPDPRVQKVTISASKSGFDLEKRKEWWSFQPIKNHKRPKVKATSWPSNDYDYFILAELEKKGLSPSKKTSKESPCVD